MSVIQIKDKRFKTFIPEEQIMKEVAPQCVEWFVHVYG